MAKRVGIHGPLPGSAAQRAARGNTDKRGAETEVDYTGPPVLPAHYEESLGKIWATDIVPLIAVRSVEVADLRLCILHCQAVAAGERAYNKLEAEGWEYETPNGLLKDRPEVKRWRDMISTVRMLSPSIGTAKGARARLQSAAPAPVSTQSAAGEAFLEREDEGE